METNPALAAGILVLTMAAAASAQTYHATIVTEDGSPLPNSPQIIPNVSERLVQECTIVTIFGDGNVQYLVNYRSRPYDPATADVCSVTIRLKGYQTAQVTFRNNVTIVLKHMGLHEGSTVSATALNVPEPARKAYGEGENAFNDEKWAAAEKNFQKAVEIDPEYAQAWRHLGEALQKESKATEARAAWEKAVAADPKYIRPYIQLAMLDLAEKRPEDAAAIAGKAVALNPLEFPELYFYNAVANYNPKATAPAEPSGLQISSDWKERPYAKQYGGWPGLRNSSPCGASSASTASPKASTTNWSSPKGNEFGSGFAPFLAYSRRSR